MSKLFQVIAARTGTSNKLPGSISGILRPTKSPVLMEGLVKKFKPSVEGAPSHIYDEHKQVQVLVRDLLPKLTGCFAKMLDLDMTVELANPSARADVVVDGKVLLKDLPVGALLVLEKRLKSLKEVVEKLPTLDPTVTWVWSLPNKAYSSPTEYTASKKTQKEFIPVAPATEHHPQQIQAVDREIIIGIFEKFSLSGALHPKEQSDLLHRLEQLIEGVAAARSLANDMSVNHTSIGTDLMTYLLESLPLTPQ